MLKYSKSAFNAGFGKVYGQVVLVCVLLAVVPIAIDLIWDLVFSTNLPMPLPYIAGIISFLFLLLGTPLALAYKVAAVRRAQHHVVSLEGGSLFVSLSIQHGWTASLAGFVYEWKEYELYSLRSFKETAREFILDGDIGCTHYHQNRMKPEIKVEALKIPKVFENECLLREFLSKSVT